MPFRIRIPRRFTLRTLLLITLAAAVGAWWYSRSFVEVTYFPDGSQMRFRQSVAKFAAGPRSGPCTLLSPDGRIMCRGEFQGDQPTGTWTFFHADGRRALSGPTANGERHGRWTAWFVSGQRRLEVEHEVYRRDFGGRTVVPQADGLVPLGVQSQSVPQYIRPTMDELVFQASRSGPAREWWDNGAFKRTGSHAHDSRHGTWTEHDRQGRSVATTNYRDGLPVRPSDPQRLAEQLRSENLHERDEALSQLELLGRDGARVLAEAVEQDTGHLRELALETLARLGPEAAPAIDTLRRLANDDLPRLRFKAKLALATADVSQAEKQVASLLADVAELPADEQSQRLRDVAEHCPALLPALTQSLSAAERTVRHLALCVVGDLWLRSASWEATPSLRAQRPALRTALAAAETHDDPIIAETARVLGPLEISTQRSGVFSGML